METNSGVNPVQSHIVADFNVSSHSVNFHREPPPPYTVEPGTTNSQRFIHETIIMQPPLKDGPMYYPCPRCQERVLTNVQYVNTRKTHMMAGFICGFTFWCFLCCLAAIPYLVPAFKKSEHYCPNCNFFLGSFSRV